MGHIDFTKPVKNASECSECPDCGEPWCDSCQEHYADCSCPGPDSDPKDYEYDLTVAKLFDEGYPSIPHQNG